MDKRLNTMDMRDLINRAKNSEPQKTKIVETKSPIASFRQWGKLNENDDRFKIGKISKAEFSPWTVTDKATGTYKRFETKKAADDYIKKVSEEDVLEPKAQVLDEEEHFEGFEDSYFDIPDDKADWQIAWMINQGQTRGMEHGEWYLLFSGSNLLDTPTGSKPKDITAMHHIAREVRNGIISGIVDGLEWELFTNQHHGNLDEEDLENFCPDCGVDMVNGSCKNFECPSHDSDWSPVFPEIDESNVSLDAYDAAYDEGEHGFRLGTKCPYTEEALRKEWERGFRKAAARELRDSERRWNGDIDEDVSENPRNYKESDIAWLVGREHVSASNEEIEALIRKRTKSWPKDQQELAVKDALKIHAKNGGLYRDVVNGNIGSGEPLEESKLNEFTDSKEAIQNWVGRKQKEGTSAAEIEKSLRGKIRNWPKDRQDAAVKNALDAHSKNKWLYDEHKKSLEPSHWDE